MKTSERIHELRTQKKLTLEELSNMVGVKKSAVWKWENEIVINIKRDTMFKLAEVLDTTPAYLMGWDNNEETIVLEQHIKTYYIKLTISDSIVESIVQAVSKHEAIGKVLEIVPTATYKNIIEVKEDT